MGIDIHVRLIKKDRSTNTWKPIKLYYKEKKKFKVVDIFPYRSYELFDLLSNNEHNYMAYPILMTNLPSSLFSEIKNIQKNNDGYGFKEINLADLKIYLQENPEIISDSDFDDSTNSFKKKPNPIKFFIERIIQYINLADTSDNYPFSDIRVIYWFDR